MPEWNDEKYIKLLSPSIWQSNASSISEKLNLECLKDYRYAHLFSPSLFHLKAKNILGGIKVLEEYGISEFVTNNCLRKNPETLKNLIEYIIEHEYDLIVTDERTGLKRLNPILNASTADLMKKYKIDLKQLNKRYAGLEK